MMLEPQQEEEEEEEAQEEQLAGSGHFFFLIIYQLNFHIFHLNKIFIYLYLFKKWWNQQCKLI